MAPQTTCVNSRRVSAPAGSRPAVASVTFVLLKTGDSQCVGRAAAITTRRLAIPRQETVLTVNTTPRGRTVKCVRSVTMVMPQVVSDRHCRLMQRQQQRQQQQEQKTKQLKTLQFSSTQHHRLASAGLTRATNLESRRRQLFCPYWGSSVHCSTRVLGS